MSAADGGKTGPVSRNPILVSGATGFIGRLLAERLLEDGYRVRCLVRDRNSAAARELEAGGCELAVADLTRPAGLEDAHVGVEAAYFLVHMIGGGDDYPAIERAAAGRFARAARQAGVARIVYLGGLGDNAGSKHLEARHRVADVLREEGPELTYFRAAMVIGAGSESYELLCAIVERLPVLPTPAWLATETQPIGAGDVVDYLREALDVPESAGREIQIGGPEVLTHLELVNEMASALGRRPPRQFSVSNRIVRPATVAAGAAAVTSGDPGVAAELSLGLSAPTVVDDPSGGRLFTTRPHRLDAVLAEAVDMAMAAR